MKSDRAREHDDELEIEWYPGPATVTRLYVTDRQHVEMRCGAAQVTLRNAGDRSRRFTVRQRNEAPVAIKLAGDEAATVPWSGA